MDDDDDGARRGGGTAEVTCGCPPTTGSTTAASAAVPAVRLRVPERFARPGSGKVEGTSDPASANAATGSGGKNTFAMEAAASVVIVAVVRLSSARDAAPDRDSVVSSLRAAVRTAIRPGGNAGAGETPRRCTSHGASDVDVDEKATPPRRRAGNSDAGGGGAGAAGAESYSPSLTRPRFFPASVATARRGADAEATAAGAGLERAGAAAPNAGCSKTVESST
jgi:hypothetical protein